MSNNHREQSPVTFFINDQQIGDGDLFPDGSLIIRHESGIKDGMELQVVDAQGQLLVIGILTNAGVVGGAKLLNPVWMGLI